MSATAATVDGRRTTRLTVPSLVGLLLAGVAFWLLAGVTGALLALGLAVSLVVFPTIFVFALGQFVLAVLLPVDAPLALVVLAEVPLLVLLLDTLPGGRQAIARGLVTVCLGLVPVVAAGVLLGTLSRRWVVAAALIAVVATLVYALHRYAAVMFPRPEDGTREATHAGE